MPYATNVGLSHPVSASPRACAGHLPRCLSHAFADHAGDPRQEEAAHRIAWAAVKRARVKAGNDPVVADDAV